MELTDYLAAGQTVVSNWLLKNYQKLNLTPLELLVYLQLLMYKQEQVEFPNLEQIAKNTGLNLNDLYLVIDQLVQKEFIAIQTVTLEGKQADYYDLNLVYQKLMPLEFSQNAANLKDKIMSIEQLLGRVLSTMEIETFRNWLEKENYDYDLIELALKEAVINNIQTPFKYANKILQNWRLQKVTTKEQAVAAIASHRKQKYQAKPKVKVPIDYNSRK